MSANETGLPACVEDSVMNRAQLASALNKSEPIITAWLAEGLDPLALRALCYGVKLAGIYKTAG